MERFVRVKPVSLPEGRVGFAKLYSGESVWFRLGGLTLVVKMAFVFFLSRG